MSQPPTLPIDPHHVILQFARRSPLDDAQFLYGEIAQRMLARLSYIRIAPKDILDAGCGAGHAIEPLRSRYPELNYIGLDSCHALIDAARQRYDTKPGLWQRLRNKPTPAVQLICADLADSGLPDDQLDLTWSNMVLHWHPQPHAVLTEWHRILKPGALVMFSCLGPGSMKNLRAALQDADINTATPGFVDMHDFGDLLVQRGFADPVMDQEILTLTYRSAEKLLDDIHILGGNPSLGRQPGLVGRHWKQRLIAALEKQRHADGTLHLELEIAYGHAWKAVRRRATKTEVLAAASKVRRGGRAPTVRPRDPEKK